MTGKNKTPEDLAHLTLEHLKYLRSSVDRLEKNDKEHSRRFDLMERALNSIRMDIAALSDIGVDHRETFRDLAERVTRIERQLELTDALDPQ
jgi:hypothetical protein